MIRDLQYPDDARKVIDSLHAGLRYDATIAVLAIGSSKAPLPGDGPDFSVPIRLGGREEDEAVRKEAPGLFSRFSLISMVSRFESHAQLLLLQRRVLEELKGPRTKMAPEAMWRILKPVFRNRFKWARSRPTRASMPSDATSSYLNRKAD